VLIVLASWTLASVLAIFGSQALTRLIGPNEIPPSAAFVIGMAVCWVIFAFLLSLAERLMPFLITFAILAGWLRSEPFATHRSRGRRDFIRAPYATAPPDTN